MGDRELSGGELTGIKADEVPSYVITFMTTGIMPVEVLNGMTLARGNQTNATPPAQPERGEPAFGTHIGEAIRVLKGSAKRQP